MHFIWAISARIFEIPRKLSYPCIVKCDFYTKLNLSKFEYAFWVRAYLTVHPAS